MAITKVSEKSNVGRSIEDLVESINVYVWEAGRSRSRIIVELRLREAEDHCSAVKAKASSLRNWRQVGYALASIGMRSMSIAFTLDTKDIVDTYQNLAGKYAWLPSGFLLQFTDSCKGAFDYDKIATAADKILNSGAGIVQQLQSLDENFSNAYRYEIDASGETSKNEVDELDRQSHAIRTERQSQAEALSRFHDALQKIAQALSS